MCCHASVAHPRAAGTRPDGASVRSRSWCPTVLECAGPQPAVVPGLTRETRERSLRTRAPATSHQRLLQGLTGFRCTCDRPPTAPARSNRASSVRCGSNCHTLAEQGEEGVHDVVEQTSRPRSSPLRYHVEFRGCEFREVAQHARVHQVPARVVRLVREVEQVSLRASPSLLPLFCLARVRASLLCG